MLVRVGFEANKIVGDVGILHHIVTGEGLDRFDTEESEVHVVGDFSKGSDGVILEGKQHLEDAAGQRVNLVEFSVSRYLLARGLDSVDMSEPDLTVVNTWDADMVTAYATDDVTAVVTWNPLLSEIDALPDSYKVFDSPRIPGEIIDLPVIDRETPAANPKLGKALVGAWYETLARMSGKDEAGVAARTAMYSASGTDPIMHPPPGAGR